MAPELRGEYSNEEKLVRLLLVAPVSSAEAERSFSTLRRLKTWLCCTITQLRLISLAVCHVHQEVLSSVDVHALIEFGMGIGWNLFRGMRSMHPCLGNDCAQSDDLLRQ
jgi:hypothetical protein